MENFQETQVVTPPARQENRSRSAAPVVLVILLCLFAFSQLASFFVIIKLEQRVALLEGRTARVEETLDYITPLAENGNRWAHSHNGW